MPDSTSPKHLPNLDGLRTLAATAVVLGHSPTFFDRGRSYVPAGWVEDYFFRQAGLGVQFFFVLSGFLITRIALTQMESPAGFSLKRFWLRRILRIWPVYFLVVAVAGLLAWRAGPFYNMVYNNWALLLCFLENFDLLALLPNGHSPGFIVSVLWSVSIEEQFYLLYPLMLVLLPRRFYWMFFATVVVAAGGYKLAHQNSDPLAVQFHTFSACYELGIGCLLALAVQKRQPESLTLLPYLALLLPLPIHWHLLVRPLLFAAIICDQAFCPRSWLQTRFVPGLNPLGKVTYGLYSYHMIVCMVLYQFLHTQGLEPQGPGQFALYLLALLTLSTALSWASYRWMERPIMALSR